MVLTVDHWYGGAAHPPTTLAYLDRENPANRDPVARVANGSQQDVDAAVAAALSATRDWRRTEPSVRGRILIELARRIRAATEELAEREVAETGKPWSAAAGEVEVTAQYFEFYGEVVNWPSGETIDLGPNLHSYTRREPFGVVAVITPWNLPVNQAARACAPAIAAGNTVVLKPSSLTSSTSFRLGELAQAAGLPDGVLNVVMGSGSTVGSALVRHPAVRKVSFTGSVDVGREIAHLAADRLIPTTLELGGKSANIVFADADLELAADTSVKAFTANAGQVCSAGTRLLVQREIHDAFIKAITARASALRPGDTLQPVISESQFGTIRKYLDIAEAEGATPVTGGVAAVDPTLPGYYVPPTVYTNVNNAMRVAREEIFGPVVAVIPFDTEDEAIAIANDSPYGLVAGVWTRDVSRAIRVADELETGQVFVNSWWSGGIQAPFGGYKMSGYGREKGVEALHHYTQTKSVTIAL